MLGMQINQFPQRWRVKAPARCAALLLLSVFISGCQHDGVMMSQAVPEPDVKNKYPISVEEHQETMPLSPVLAGKKLGNADAKQVAAFAGGFLQQGQGSLSIILPSIPGTPETAGQMQAINDILADRGVPASRIEWRIATPVAAPAAASGASPAATASAAARPPLIFSYTRYVASMQRECGNWEKDLGTSHDNKAWTNFGCAHQNNLAAMVSDPLDLKRPRATTPVDVDRRTVVIKSYREGKTTATERTDAEKGTVSEVAK